MNKLSVRLGELDNLSTIFYNINFRNKRAAKQYQKKKVITVTF